MKKILYIRENTAVKMNKILLFALLQIAASQDLPADLPDGNVIDEEGLEHGQPSLGRIVRDYFYEEYSDYDSSYTPTWSKAKIIAQYGYIKHWDTAHITNMAYLFAYLHSIEPDISAWDVSSVTNMNTMFGYSTFSPDISAWDVSSATDMSYMFKHNDVFNQDISTQQVTNGDTTYTAWDVSSVTRMNEMFSYASEFNQNISKWDVSSVMTMDNMFSYASKFNQDISLWDVSSVTNMEGMFFSASNFNQDISLWDVSSVMSMDNMFSYATDFDQELCGMHWKDSPAYIKGSISQHISAFYCSCAPGKYLRTTSMLGLSNTECIPCEAGYQDEQNFVGSSCSDCYLHLRADHTRCFEPGTDPLPDGASGLRVGYLGDIVDNYYEKTANKKKKNIEDKYGPIELWDTSAVTNMESLFNHVQMAYVNPDISAVNPDISAWDVSSVTTMYHMFEAASKFNQDLGKWNVSAVTDMEAMFFNAINFNGNVRAWDVSSVTDMAEMFSGATSFNQQLCSQSWIDANENGITFKDDANAFFDNTAVAGFSNVVCACSFGFSFNSGICDACTSGQYQDEISETDSPCKVCASGRYQDENVQSTCIDCSAGKYSEAGVGQISETVCESCIVGKYQDQVAQSACKVCASGQYSETAQSACSHPKCAGEECTVQDLLLTVTPQDLVTAYQARGNCGN